MNENQQIGHLIEPNPITFSFGAPGWYILLAIVFVILAIIGLLLFLRHKKRKYRRQAILQLQEFKVSNHSSTAFLTHTMATIKQVAITSYERENLVHLSGVKFLDLLKKRNKNKTVFSEDIEALYSKGLYQNTELSKENQDKIIKESINWINNHHV